MAWRSSGISNVGLVENLAHNGLIKSQRVKAAMLAVRTSTLLTGKKKKKKTNHDSVTPLIAIFLSNAQKWKRKKTPVYPSLSVVEVFKLPFLKVKEGSFIGKFFVQKQFIRLVFGRYTFAHKKV